MGKWLTRIVKAYAVETYWNDGSVSRDEFPVSDYDDPKGQAIKLMNRRMRDSDWLNVSIRTIHAEHGEKITVKVQHQS